MPPMSRAMQWGIAFGGILAEDLVLPCQQSKEQTNHSRLLPIRRMVPNSFHWCPATGRGAMATN